MAVVKCYECKYFSHRLIIENGKISDVKLGVFTVTGSTGNPHAVRLFSKEFCTRPSSGLCYHILIAAKLSIGMNVHGCSHKKINLSQVLQNSRSRKDETFGRKDLDVEITNQLQIYRLLVIQMWNL